MNVYRFFGVCATALMLTVSPVVTSADEYDAALERMDAIILEMQELRAEFASLSNQVPTAPTPAVQGVQAGSTLTEDLSYGATNEDIARIQRLLATDVEIYAYGVASGYFGPKTQEAVRNFQTRFGLDPVGVVGPATRALLEIFFAAYPDEDYPANVLANKPVGTVAGAATSATPTPSEPTTTATNSGNPAHSIVADRDDDEHDVVVTYQNGNTYSFTSETDDQDEVIEEIYRRTPLTEAQVRDVITFVGDRVDEASGSDEEQEKAEEALDDADDAIDDADDAIDEAEEDGGDTDWAEDTLDDAEDLLEEAEEAYDDGDYDDAIELAKEAEELAEEAEDRIDETEETDADDIEEIEVEVGDGESEVTVEYENGDEDEFDVDEDDEDDIIEAIADELDIDEDDVEDLIEFDYGDIEEIEVRVDDTEALVRVHYDSGAEQRFYIDEDDEDDMLEDIADELDEDVEDLEDLTDFDY